MKLKYTSIILSGTLLLSLASCKKELVKVKKGIQNYQIEKYPELSHSIVQHGKGNKNIQSEKEYQYKRRTGRETNKNQILVILQTSYKNALSKKQFFESLNLSDVSTYSRNGKVTGVVYKGRKFRFSRLGFTEERLNGLDKSLNRNRELEALRNRSKDKTIKKQRHYEK